jgi:hypothetical protein
VFRLRGHAGKLEYGVGAIVSARRRTGQQTCRQLDVPSFRFAKLFSDCRDRGANLSHEARKIPFVNTQFFGPMLDFFWLTQIDAGPVPQLI